MKTHYILVLLLALAYFIPFIYMSYIDHMIEGIILGIIMWLCNVSALTLARRL